MPDPADLPGSSAGGGFYLTPPAQIVRDAYAALEGEFGRVDVFVDLHNQAPCYQEGDALPNIVTIDEPTEAAGTYEAAGASFGADPTRGGVGGDVVSTPVISMPQARVKSR